MNNYMAKYLLLIFTILLASTLLGISATPSLASETASKPEATGPESPSTASDEGNNKKDNTDVETDPTVKEIIKKFGAWKDEAMQHKVDDISQKLINASDKPDAESIKFILLDDDSVNAFALSDGYIFLFRGLVERCETDDQLASVMAHEMTHVLYKHHNRGGNTVTAIELLGILAAITAEQQEPAIAGQMISAALIESYGRDAEIEADCKGADLMIRAGYDPLGMLEFFGYMEGLQRRRPQMQGNYFTVHPYPEDRGDNIRAYLKAKGIEIPDILYRLHLALDLDCHNTDDHFECTIFVGDQPTFILAGENEDELMERGYEVIGRLRDAFSKGLRDYEVNPREKDGTYFIVAKHSILVSVTRADVLYMGKDAQTINDERLEKLKYILWQYYIERRI